MSNGRVRQVCIVQLDHICFEKSSLTFLQVRCCALRTRRSCQKHDEDFSNFVAFSENPNFNLSHLYRYAMTSGITTQSMSIFPWLRLSLTAKNGPIKRTIQKSLMTGHFTRQMTSPPKSPLEHAGKVCT